MNLDSTIFCIFDLETTGLNPWYGHRICEIGALTWENGEETDLFHTLVDPGRPISPGAYGVHGITQEMVKDAPSFYEVADDFLRFIDNHVLVAHNASFDLGFLSTHLQSLPIPMPHNPVVDTLTLARRYYSFPSNSLPSIARYLGIGVGRFHRATNDVKITASLLAHFLRDFKAQGITTLEELLSMQGGPIEFPHARKVVLPAELEEAFRNRKKIRIRYLSSTLQETERVIEPIEVYASHKQTYLRAYCSLRGDKRTFRLDRIQAMAVEG